MAKSAELKHLNMMSDVMDAINRLGKKYEMLDVLEYMREWVAFMDQAQAIAEKIAAQRDGSQHGEDA